jgi:hypothetical protein
VEGTKVVFSGAFRGSFIHFTTVFFFWHFDMNELRLPSALNVIKQVVQCLRVPRAVCSSACMVSNGKGEVVLAHPMKA